jgi:hypothetical protein
VLTEPPPTTTLRSEFGTYLCFDPQTAAIVHLPPTKLAIAPLICIPAGQPGSFKLISATNPTDSEPLPIPPPLLVQLPTGKILLGLNGAQLAVCPNGTTECLPSPVGLSGEFWAEPLADTLAIAQRRPLKTFRAAIFTAAGDHSQIPLWLANPQLREYALIAAYYGNDPATFAQIRAQADIALRGAGGKYQILKTLFIRQPGLFENFDYILLADDDLIWSTAAINRAFALAAQFDLWLCQPAFDPAGRISYPVTAKCPGPQTLRYTNFVETTCPIFRTDKLRDFLTVFDGSMSGYGVDFWFCDALGGGLNMKFAILDEVTVINPHERTKPGGRREIDTLRPLPDRIEEWQQASRNYNIRRIRPRILGHATQDPEALAAARAG